MQRCGDSPPAGLVEPCAGKEVEQTKVQKVSPEAERTLIIKLLFDLFIQKESENKDSRRVYKDLIIWIDKEDNVQTKVSYKGRLGNIHTEFRKNK